MPLPQSSAIDTYGGVKEDRAPVANSRTTLAAAEHNAMACDLAMMSRMTPRAFRRFIGGDPPTEPTDGVAHDAQWGNRVADLPAVERLRQGTYRITWPDTVADELGIEHLFTIRWAHAWTNYPSAVVCVRPQDARSITLDCTFADGSTFDAYGSEICVLVY